MIEPYKSAQVTREVLPFANVLFLFSKELETPALIRSLLSMVGDFSGGVFAQPKSRGLDK